MTLHKQFRIASPIPNSSSPHAALGYLCERTDIHSGTFVQVIFTCSTASRAFRGHVFNVSIKKKYGDACYDYSACQSLVELLAMQFPTSTGRLRRLNGSHGFKKLKQAGRVVQNISLCAIRISHIPRRSWQPRSS